MDGVRDWSVIEILRICMQTLLRQDGPGGVRDEVSYRNSPYLKTYDVTLNILRSLRARRTDRPNWPASGLP